MTVKLLGGIVLLGLSMLWAVLWGEKASGPYAAVYPDYQVVLILVASMALIPTIWATSLIDRACRLSPKLVTAPEELIALPEPHTETETESDDQLVDLTPYERDLVKAVLREFPDASVADVIAEIKSPMAATEAMAAE
jgi:hypothetical protein